MPLPHVCLTVSGGHTMLVYVKGLCQYEVMGNTLDDAAGEAFDKIAKFLNIGFPGGPAIDRLSLRGSRTAFDLPRPMVRNRSLDFSFSGLKTCVVNMFRGGSKIPSRFPTLPPASRRHCRCSGFQGASGCGAQGRCRISVTGGVSSNRRLRESFRETCGRLGLEVFFPLPELRTDNAAMVAAAGAARLERGEVSGLDLNAVPTARWRAPDEPPDIRHESQSQGAAEEVHLERSRGSEKGRAGGLPTETVYGLGADALNAHAVKQILWPRAGHWTIP